MNGKYRNFTQNKHWKDDGCWWEVMMFSPETRQIRIDYINTLIEEL